MAKVIMIQGTMSNAGKSLLAAGLCRIFPQRTDNLHRNPLEMGRAQVMQAEAAGIEPSVLD